MKTAVVLLERLASLIQQSLREDAARHGLLPIHVQVLAYLGQANRYSDIPIAVAEYLGITRGTVSQTLALLERKGLIEKQADPRHGRRIHLSLTEAGRAVTESSWLHRVDEALGGAECSHPDFETGLRSLLAALQRLNHHHAFGICRQCAHFLVEPDGTRCGLTSEPLSIEQTTKICREWLERPAAE